MSGLKVERAVSVEGLNSLTDDRLSTAYGFALAWIRAGDTALISLNDGTITSVQRRAGTGARRPYARAGIGEDLRLLILSSTLDDEALARTLKLKPSTVYGVRVRARKAA